MKNNIDLTDISLVQKKECINQSIADLENINAHLFSIEALMERVFDVKVPNEVEDLFDDPNG